MQRNANNSYSYKVKLSSKDHQAIRNITDKGKINARVMNRAKILEYADNGEKDLQICAKLGISRSTVHDVRKHYCEEGLGRALYDLPRPGQPRKLTGIQEATIIAITCTPAPKGHDHWTMDLLTRKAQSDGIQASRSEIYLVLLRNNQKPWLKNCGAFLR